MLRLHEHGAYRSPLGPATGNPDDVEVAGLVLAGAAIVLGDDDDGSLVSEPAAATRDERTDAG